jgi:hypothetical protein
VVILYSVLWVTLFVNFIAHQLCISAFLLVGSVVVRLFSW